MAVRPRGQALVRITADMAQAKYRYLRVGVNGTTTNGTSSEVQRHK